MGSRSILSRNVIPRLLSVHTLSFVPTEEPHSEMPPVPEPRRGAVAGLILTLLLVLGGVFLVHVLRGTATLQDCLLSGRTNCAPISSPMSAGR